MNGYGAMIRRMFALWMAFSLTAATGCAPMQTKSTKVEPETTSPRESKTEIREGIKQEYLQGMLMGFADTFLSRYATAINLLLEQESSPRRIFAARSKFLIGVSAVDIASGPYPGIGLADMVVLVTLIRMAWEDYWQPEVFGDPALMVVKTLRESEEEVWDIAARVLIPEQLRELRALIYEWRKKTQVLKA